jgi:hypothetical protein
MLDLLSDMFWWQRFVLGFVFVFWLKYFIRLVFPRFFLDEHGNLR